MNIKEKISVKLKNYSSERPLTIAFLGDSVTHGCFECIEIQPDRKIDCVYDYDAVYHEQFRRKFNAVFPQCPLTVINAGISGGSAEGGNARLERDILTYSPDVAVVCFGLNDVFVGDEDAYISSLHSIFLRMIKENIEPVFLTPNMMCTDPYVTPLTQLNETSEKCAELQNNGTFDRYIDDAVEMALSEGVAVCDCYKEWKKIQYMGMNTTYLLANGINHPIREMHNLFASKLFDKIILN